MSHKKKYRRRKRITVLGALLSILMAGSLCLLFAGAWRLLKLDHSLDDGAEQAEIQLLRTAESDESIVSDAKDARGAIGALTFPDGGAAPIYYGTADETLERGAGLAEDTAALNTPGNAVLFGHRDSAFRSMATLKEGETLLLTSAGCQRRYRVARLYITHPEDGHIYDPAEKATVTLVTCYPFSFVGPAPERYVAVAEMIAE